MTERKISTTGLLISQLYCTYTYLIINSAFFVERHMISPDTFLYIVELLNVGVFVKRPCTSFAVVYKDHMSLQADGAYSS